MVEPDWTQIRESETWPVLVDATFVDSYDTAAMNEFAGWLDQVEGPGPVRRLTHFRDRVMTFAFPADADPAVVRWWIDMAQLQTEVFGDVRAAPTR